MAFLRSKRLRVKKTRIAARLESLPAKVFEKTSFDRNAVKALEANLHGTVVLPGDPDYDEDRQESNPLFDAHPQIIVYCETYDDVKLCLEFAHRWDLWAVCRSGGHSTAGYSVNDGMVIDTSRLSYVVVDAEKKQVVVGAGTDFATLNGTLDRYQLHVPSGGCPDVHVAGYMQGGGYGFTSRKYGIHCDNVLSFRMMLADGTIVTASEEENQDLRWAVCGGTGNNFGVLLDVTYKLHDLWWVWAFGLKWKLEDAPAALLEMQNGFMKTGASPNLGYMSLMTTQGDGGDEKYLLMRGMYDGDPNDGRKELEPLLATRGCELQIDMTGSYKDMNVYLLSKPEELPAVPDPWPEDKQSGYIAEPLKLSDWEKISEHFGKSSIYSTLVIEPYGGAINAYPKGGNAFIHRDVYMDIFLDVFWPPDDQKKMKDVTGYLDHFMNVLMKPYLNGHAYQNYPRRTQTDYRWLYWGTFFESLLLIKQKYDPHNFFHYQQSISPPPENE